MKDRKDTHQNSNSDCTLLGKIFTLFLTIGYFYNKGKVTELHNIVKTWVLSAYEARPSMSSPF